MVLAAVPGHYRKAPCALYISKKTLICRPAIFAVSVGQCFFAAGGKSFFRIK